MIPSNNSPVSVSINESPEMLLLVSGFLLYRELVSIGGSCSSDSVQINACKSNVIIMMNVNGGDDDEENGNIPFAKKCDCVFESLFSRVKSSREIRQSLLGMKWRGEDVKQNLNL